jgi:hypothetical protein
MNSRIPPDNATLDSMSAYLDGRLSAPETAALEEKLRQHPEWRSTLEELAAVRSLLRSLPELRPPRNLLLSRASLSPERRWSVPALAYGFGSALAGVAAILLFVFGTLKAPMAASPQAQSMMREAGVAGTPGVPSVSDQAATPEVQLFAAAPMAPKMAAGPAETPSEPVLSIAGSNAKETPDAICPTCETHQSDSATYLPPTLEMTNLPVTALLPVTLNGSPEETANQQPPTRDVPITMIFSLVLGACAFLFGILFFRIKRG